MLFYRLYKIFLNRRVSQAMWQVVVICLLTRSVSGFIKAWSKSPTSQWFSVTYDEVF